MMNTILHSDYLGKFRKAKVIHVLAMNSGNNATDQRIMYSLFEIYAR